jgi:hypothetical protein
MRRLLRARLLASAFAVTAFWPMASVAPAQAQYEDAVSFDYFHDVLQQYGYWLYSDRWGLVWQPQYVPGFFRPYDSDGHWIYTDAFGWYWQSDKPWGDIAFHYGRWVNDPDDGWLWIPGYTWSPAWVVWRSNGQYVGWMPAPPDERFLRGEGDISFGLSFGGARLSLSWNGEPDYGYRTWYGPDFDERWYAQNWIIVGVGHLADPNFHDYSVQNPVQVVNIIHNTTNITSYTVVNNYVVNRGISISVVQHAAGHPIAIEPARAVIRNPRLVLSVNTSRQIQERERSFTPHGSGFANSAPPPPPQVVGKLSANRPAHNGPQPSHLFTRATVTNPQVQTHFHGPSPGGTMMGPGTEHGAPGEMANPHAAGGAGPAMGTEMNHRPEQGPSGTSGQAQTFHPESGPAAGGPPMEMQHQQEEGPANGGGMRGAPMGPGSGPPPGEVHHHVEQGPSMGGPGEMGGPSGGPPPSEVHHHHEEQGPPGGGGAPGEMGGPSAETHHHQEQASPGAAPKSSPPPPPPEQGKPEKKKPEKQPPPPPQ